MVFLFQDPRMGGEKYWHTLLKALGNAKLKFTQLTMELFSPAINDMFLWPPLVANRGPHNGFPFDVRNTLMGQPPLPVRICTELM